MRAAPFEIMKKILFYKKIYFPFTLMTVLRMITARHSDFSFSALSVMTFPSDADMHLQK